jgi:hypothetical protein
VKNAMCSSLYLDRKQFSVVISIGSDVDFRKNENIIKKSSPNAETAATGMLNRLTIRQNIMHTAIMKRRSGEMGLDGPTQASAGM